MTQTIQTEVLVIGGGATGAGVLRDLALRGFRAVLVERGDLTVGTTGRYHGLLHSGGRYVVRDPLAAKECIQENRILRKIMPQCIEDTGGFFVLTPEDNPDYAPKFVAGCQQAGIPVEEISIAQMLREEPRLNPNIVRCFRVPDGSADSFLGADLTVESARQHGAEVLRYHKVLELLTQGSRVVGARCHDLVKDETIDVHADLVVNAAGAWAGQVAANTGLKIHIVPGKGTMIALSHRIVNTVINRCKMPSDGDILVPAHTVAIIGTTDVKVADPDHFAIEPWEVELLLNEGEKLVPGFKEMRMLRAWGGVRPLYQESAVSDTRDVTRAFVLLDHELRDGVSGLVTITSGKWTTYRKMAEVTVDLVCSKLGVQRECRTHLEPLPGGAHEQHFPGTPLARVEKEAAYGSLVCECELATRADVVHAIEHNQAKTIDDVRRDVRLGMGPCQGGFCTYRVAGILQELRSPPVFETNVALRDFLQERWKGLLPILWGQQLRQERLDELIYLGILNADHLPGPHASRLGPVLYEPPVNDHQTADATPAATGESAGSPAAFSQLPHDPDLLVIGAGLAGLVTAWQAAANGKRVRVIAKGWGANHWNAGCIDVLGYDPANRDVLLESPAEGIRRLTQTNPRHPYTLVGLDGIEAAIRAFQELAEQAGSPLHGSLERNWLLPSALGTPRPTCLAPETMIAGDLSRHDPMLLVGFKQYLDFYPQLAARNLEAQGIDAQGLILDLPALRERRFVTSRVLTDSFESAEFRAEVVSAIRDAIKPNHLAFARIGFPAVLGLHSSLAVKGDLEARLGLPVFEIPTLPPSFPGIRLHNLLVKAIGQLGGRVYDGMQVVAADISDRVVQTVWSESSVRNKANRGRSIVLATGGILGGGFRASSAGGLSEGIFNLPLDPLPHHSAWFEREFLSPLGHPIYRAGVFVRPDFRPITPQGELICTNLFAVGGALGGCDVIQDRSLEGVALASGYLVGNRIGQDAVQSMQ